MKNDNYWQNQAVELIRLYGLTHERDIKGLDQGQFEWFRRMPIADFQGVLSTAKNLLAAKLGG